jgi:hypothetical protein
MWVVVQFEFSGSRFGILIVPSFLHAKEKDQFGKNEKGRGRREGRC